MSKVICEREDLIAIADAVRNKTGDTSELTLGGIAGGINGISTTPVLQNKTVTPSAEFQIVAADAGYDGLNNVTVEGDSNLVPENIISGKSIFGVDGIAEVGDGNIDHSIEDAMITRDINGDYSNDRVITIGHNAFDGCISLTTVDFPNATSIDYSAFDGCTSLTTVDFPNVTSIGYDAFDGCASLTTVEFPNATSIGSSAFVRCTSLTTVDFPNVTSIDSMAFAECTSLTTVEFPNATSIGSNAFDGCISLTTVDLPNATSIGYSAFDRCRPLTIVDFPNATFIGGYAFAECTSLTTVILRHYTVCVLESSNAFSYNADNRYIYVPSSLVDSYKTATNWSVYTNFIRAIEDYPDITGGWVVEEPDDDGSGEPITCYIDGYAVNTYDGAKWSDITMNIATGEGGEPLFIEEAGYMLVYCASEDDGYYVVEGNSFTYLRNSIGENDYVRPYDRIIANHNYILMSE